MEPKLEKIYSKSVVMAAILPTDSVSMINISLHSMNFFIAEKPKRQRKNRKAKTVKSRVNAKPSFHSCTYFALITNFSHNFFARHVLSWILSMLFYIQFGF